MKSDGGAETENPAEAPPTGQSLSGRVVALDTLEIVIEAVQGIFVTRVEAPENIIHICATDCG